MVESAGIQAFCRESRAREILLFVRGAQPPLASLLPFRALSSGDVPATGRHESGKRLSPPPAHPLETKTAGHARA